MEFTPLNIIIIITSISAIISSVMFSISLKKYDKSAIHIKTDENNMLMDKITKDPKWKHISLISKLITILLFLCTFILILISCKN